MNLRLFLFLSLMFMPLIAHGRPAQEPTVIIGLINNGMLQLEKYSLHEFTGTLTKEFRTNHTLCALDLANPDYCFNCVSCDQLTNNLIKVSSVDITDEHSYIINWGALLGFNIADYPIDSISFIPWQHHEITSNHVRAENDAKTSIVKMIYTFNGIRHEEIIQFDCLIESMCGIISADSIAIEANRIGAPIDFKEATHCGILVSEKNIENQNKKFSMERDAEFDRIIDEMSKDGLIKFPTVTPLMALVRHFGGIILVKYLIVKKYVTNLFHHVLPAHKESKELRV